MNAYGLLALAIAAEIVGTSALKLSDGMTKFGPGAIVIVGYGAAFWLLSLTLKTLPVGLVYALWSGIGVAAIKVIGVLLFRESFTTASIAGTLLIIAGVVLVQVSAPKGVP